MNNKILLLRNYFEDEGLTQRQMAARLDISLGAVNSLIAECEDEDLIEKGGRLTKKGKEELEKYKVDNAVIFAAGFGSRFAPLSWGIPKALFHVFGERLIERQIRQLHEAGITDITVMVGYMKEKFEYLKKKYNVKLRENPEYDSKNTLSTMHYAKDLFLGHTTYLLYSDHYLRENMFHAYEPDAWYSAAFKEGKTSEWVFVYNKKKLITSIQEGGENAWCMYGPVCYTREFSEQFLPIAEQYYQAPSTENDYIENIMIDWLRSGNRIVKLNSKKFPALYINRQPNGQVAELNSLDELIQFDEYYKGAEINHAIDIICKSFGVSPRDIKNVQDVKVDLNNHSFIFTVNQRPYFCRAPWNTKNELVNRISEHRIIEAIKPLDINEKVVYFEDETGYKISEYYLNAVNADIKEDDDLIRCFSVLHTLHKSGIKADNKISYRYILECCEKNCLEVTAVNLPDYMEYREKVFKLIRKLESLNRPEVLCHFDTGMSNFLFLNNHEDLRLIDWEYAGMGDPLCDVASMCNHHMLTPKETDYAIDLYFRGIGREATMEERGIVYAGIAAMGLAWALWGVMACSMGGYYEEYRDCMYNLVKEYYKEAEKCLSTT